MRTGGARTRWKPALRRPSPEDTVAERPTEPASEQGFDSHNGWDREYEVYDDFDMPT